MNSLTQALDKLEVVTTSPAAFIAYITVVIVYLIITLRVRRNKNLLENLDKLPKKDRLTALKAEMGVVELEKGISPKDWFRIEIKKYNLIIIGMIPLLIIYLTVLSFFKTNELKDDTDNAKAFPEDLNNSDSYVPPTTSISGYVNLALETRGIIGNINPKLYSWENKSITSYEPKRIDGSPASITQNGKYVLLNSNEGAKIFDTKKKQIIWNSNQEQYCFNSSNTDCPVAWNQAGDLFAVTQCGEDSKIKISIYKMEIPIVTLKKEITIESYGSVLIFADNSLFIGYDNGLIKWNLGNETIAWNRTFNRSEKQIKSLSIQAKSNLIIMLRQEFTMDTKPEVHFINMKKGNDISPPDWIADISNESFSEICLNPVLPVLIAATNEEGSVCLYHDFEPRFLRCFGDNIGTVVNPIFSAEGNKLSAVWWDRGAVIIDFESQEAQYALSHGSNRIIGISVSSNGDKIVTYDNEGISYLWEF